MEVGDKVETFYGTGIVHTVDDVWADIDLVKPHITQQNGIYITSLLVKRNGAPAPIQIITQRFFW